MSSGKLLIANALVWCIDHPRMEIRRLWTVHQVSCLRECCSVNELGSTACDAANQNCPTEHGAPLGIPACCGEGGSGVDATAEEAA
eukprot:3907173-Amphidinium_carterae.1